MKGGIGAVKSRCVAFYIRLSDADEGVKAGVKDESNSITAQRELLHGFLQKSADYKDAEVLEYFDDGFSGTGFSKRESFQKIARKKLAMSIYICYNILTYYIVNII